MEGHFVTFLVLGAGGAARVSSPARRMQGDATGCPIALSIAFNTHIILLEWNRRTGTHPVLRRINKQNQKTCPLPFPWIAAGTVTPCRTDVPEPDGPEERDGPHGPDPTHPKIPTHSMDPTMDPTDPDACNRHRTRVVSVAVRDDVVRDDVGDAARLSTRRGL